MFKVSVVQRSPRIFFEFISIMVLFIIFYIFIGLDKDIFKFVTNFKSFSNFNSKINACI